MKEAGRLKLQTSILFVCLGNICRSPAAEAVFKKIVNENQSDQNFFIDSAGTSAFHAGEPADARMIATGGKRGLELTSVSRQFVRADFEKFDLILVMDDSNFGNVKKLDTENEFHSKIVKMTDYASGNFKVMQEVPDPYYGGQDGFELVFDLLENCCQNLFRSIC